MVVELAAVNYFLKCKYCEYNLSGSACEFALGFFARMSPPVGDRKFQADAYTLNLRAGDAFAIAKWIVASNIATTVLYFPEITSRLLYLGTTDHR